MAAPDGSRTPVSFFGARIRVGGVGVLLELIEL